MEEDYRGQHTAPDADSGAPLHDTTGVYPADLYGPKGLHYYGDATDPIDQESYRHTVRLKGKPEAPVRIYRAVPYEPSSQEKLVKLESDMAAYQKRRKLPKDAGTTNGSQWYDNAYDLREKLRTQPNEVSSSIATINPGDWVTPSRAYAKMHGDSALRGKYKILSKMVKAKDVFTNGDSLNEWGYSPEIHKEDGGGITAYHGSPHDFEQFDTSKIGTGEGAQAYGHGLYFAEHEPVAKGYAKEIAKQQHVDPSMHFDGGTIYQGQELNDLTPAQIAAHVVADNGIDTAHKLMSEWAQDYYSGPMWKSALQALQENPNKFADAKWKHGHMYEVAIDAHPDHFLDWDKPISGQSEHAKNAVSNLVADRYLHPTFRNELADLVDRGWFTGEKLHEKLTAKHGLPMAAGLLDKHGLHGIKYFDAGSRGSNEQQTRNYVVFDHNRVKVRRKYEQGGAVAKSPAKLHNPAIVEHVLTKVSAPPPALNPSPVASGDARSKPSGDTYV